MKNIFTDSIPDRLRIGQLEWHSVGSKTYQTIPEPNDMMGAIQIRFEAHGSQLIWKFGISGPFGEINLSNYPTKGFDSPEECVQAALRVVGLWNEALRSLSKRGNPSTHTPLDKEDT